MELFLQPYSSQFRLEIITRIAKFFGFHFHLSDANFSGNIDYKAAEETLEEWLCKSGTLYMILLDDKAVGFIRIGYRGENVAWIEDIFVDEAYRNRGIATKSIRLAEQIIKSNPQYTAVCLDVSAKNTSALRLYHKLGYDTLSMVTVRKEFVQKISSDSECISGLQFKL